MKIFFLILASIAFAHEPQADYDEETPDVPTQLKEVDQAVHSTTGATVYCGWQEPTCPDSTGGVFSLAEETRCTDLFSETPPACLAPALAAVPGARKRWQPLCSMLSLNLRRDLNPDQTLTQALESIDKRLIKLDACAKGAAAMRGSPGYVAPSQEDRNLEVLTAERREAVVAQFEKMRAKTQDACCGKDEECRKILADVSLKFCKHQDDPTLPDRCTSWGTYFSFTAEQNKAYKEVFNTYPTFETARGQLPAFGGQIVLSPFERFETAIVNSASIAHEFAHACSSARRRLAANRGDEAAYRLLTDGRKRYDSDSNPTTSCLLTKEAIDFYRVPLKESGAEPATLDCMSKVAANIANNRFVEGACPRACPAAALEEAWADWMRVVANLSVDSVEKFLPDICFRTRDNEHPLIGDTLPCYLQTPGIFSELKEVLNCKK